MPERLVLVGMMGAGKSTVGRLLAERLGRVFVDVDDEIVRLAGGSVADIFDSGERDFRDLERQCLRGALDADADVVVAAGGGAVLDADNRARMRLAGTVVWLRATPATLSERVGDGSGRPLLENTDEGGLAVLNRLSAERAALYEEVAHAVVDTDGLSTAEVADRVLALVTP
ncbi:MAG TPA: shikimate kinase [Acidimicrobiales bacterium]|nr:shikimate kinase [Acidimicrobiales bacterium]